VLSEYLDDVSLGCLLPGGRFSIGSYFSTRRLISIDLGMDDPDARLVTYLIVQRCEALDLRLQTRRIQKHDGYFGNEALSLKRGREEEYICISMSR
jgi:hypothetical protein